MRIGLAGGLVASAAFLLPVGPPHPPEVPAPVVAAVPVGRCYDVQRSVPIEIRVHGVQPRGNVLAGAPETADTYGRADAHGTIRLKLSVPWAVPGNKPAAALLISVQAPNGNGEDETVSVAAIIGTRKACAALRRLAHRRDER